MAYNDTTPASRDNSRRNLVWGIGIAAALAVVVAVAMPDRDNDRIDDAAPAVGTTPTPAAPQ